MFVSPAVLSAAIVENMAEFRPGLCTEAAQQGLMLWLLKRVKVSLSPSHSLSHSLTHSLTHSHRSF